MFAPIKWLKPRLKSLCVGFGAADLSLVLISAIGWYFFFDVSFRAQQDHILIEYRTKNSHAHHQIVKPTPAPGSSSIRPFKENTDEEELRLERTVRACGLDTDRENDIDQNFAAPAAMIGASMGGFAILGGLLVSLSLIISPPAKKVICQVALIGESLCTIFLFVGVAVLLTENGLCPTEYYFESFQPIFHTFIFTLIFISSYKTYEITVILFYLVEESRLSYKETLTNNTLRRSINLPLVGKSAMELGEYEDHRHHDHDHDDHDQIEGMGAEELYVAVAAVEAVAELNHMDMGT